MINLDDVDTEPLCEADFYEASSRDGSTLHDDAPVNCGWYLPSHGAFMIELARLSQLCTVDLLGCGIPCLQLLDTDPGCIVYRVLKMACASRASSSEKLQYLSTLRNDIYQQPPSSTHLSASDFVNWNQEEMSPVWHISLEINKERILSLLHRTMVSVKGRQNGRQTNGSKPLPEREHIVRSAERIIAHFEHLFRLDLLKYSHGFL